LLLTVRDDLLQELGEIRIFCLDLLTNVGVNNLLPLAFILKKERHTEFTNHVLHFVIPLVQKAEAITRAKIRCLAPPALAM
jgi:hypothetical protein